MTLHPRLLAAQRKLDKAELAFDAVLKEVQNKCGHEVVHARRAGKPFLYLDTYWQEARVCKACGMYEQGYWGRFRVLTTENVVEHGFDFDIYKHRITSNDVSAVTNGDRT